VSHIIALKKAAVAVGIERHLSGYRLKPPFGIDVSNPEMGDKTRTLLRRVSYSKEYVYVPTVAAAARFYLAHKSGTHYLQHRPMQLKPWPQLLTFLDCSAFVTQCYYVAKRRDPNGLGYNGAGYTGTLIANGMRVPTPAAGDLVFYGAPGGNGEHVAIYVGNGQVIGHGHEGGPELTPVHYRGDFMCFRHYGTR